MEALESADLPESIFFTARKARIRSEVQESTGASSSLDIASSSSEYYSARVHSILQRMSEVDMSKEDAEIEASKDHWTVPEPEYFTPRRGASVDSLTSESESVGCTEVWTKMDRLKLYEENVEVMRSLQRENPESGFFQIGDGGVVLGRKIAEGGQAEIYDGGSKNHTTETWIDQGFKVPVVLKVFKAGYSLLDLQKQWPLTLLHKLAAVNGNGDFMCNPILYGRLLGDGRFAFEMLKFWGDLRKLLDIRMYLNGNQYPPFMMPDGNYHECCMLRMMRMIAVGMVYLHRAGILHRDLKASNVLIESNDFGVKEECRLDPIELKHDILCFITDYECSIGVVGTGYWRAPEILEALKKGTVHTTPDLFTPKSDVYSYAMTCYEILTGCIPFEEYEGSGQMLVEDVLQGRRPTLPIYLRPWIKELLNRCWHMDPLERPTFDEVYDILEDIIDNDRGCQDESVFFKFHEDLE